MINDASFRCLCISSILSPFKNIKCYLLRILLYVFPIKALLKIFESFERNRFLLFCFRSGYVRFKHCSFLNFYLFVLLLSSFLAILKTSKSYIVKTKFVYFVDQKLVSLLNFILLVWSLSCNQKFQNQEFLFSLERTEN